MGHTILSKVCQDCSKRKSVDYFYKVKGGLLGRRAECKECTSKRRARNETKKRRNASRTQFATLVLQPACLILLGFWDLIPAF